MSNKITEEKVIEEHRKMIILTGNISDFQLNNLKKWPFIVFNDTLNSVSISYNFIKDNSNSSELTSDIKELGTNQLQVYSGQVEFHFKLDEEKLSKMSDIKYRLIQLSNWVKYLFWLDTEVIFIKNGELWIIQ